MKTGVASQYKRVLSLHKNAKLDADYYATRQREAEVRRTELGNEGGNQGFQDEAIHDSNGCMNSGPSSAGPFIFGSHILGGSR